jgi:K(+)-stimulated pyrophosphate-energized sodium pump
VAASIIGLLAARLVKDPQNGLRVLMYASYAVIAAALYLIATSMFSGPLGMDVFIAAIAGIFSGIVISWTAEYYTSKDYRPVKDIAKASQTGTGTLLIAGFAEAFMSAVPQVLVVCASIAVAFHFAGMYGIVVAGLGMLSIIAAITALDTYGPISDNAGGIAEMSELDPKVREVTDGLDSVGNTVKALTKGFAMGASALISLSLLSAYSVEAGLSSADILTPGVLIGALLGAMMPFMFSAFCMKAVGKTAFDVVEEVRRQWREIKGLPEGKAKPDYARCVDICTQSSIRELILPGLLVVAGPVAVGYLLGAASLAGFIAGATISAFVLAALMVNAGGAWDNAKKYIEDGNYGGKGSPAHAAAVVGDTLGDPFKDTAGPALNIVIKLIAVVSLVLAPLFVQYSLKLLG